MGIQQLRKFLPQFLLILCDTDEDKDKELKAINVLKEQRIQGLIITPTFYKDTGNSENLNTLKNLGIPIILIDGHVEYLDFSGVFIDHIKGAYDGTAALIEAGHRKIAIITGDMNSLAALTESDNSLIYGFFSSKESLKEDTNLLNISSCSL